MVTEGRPVAAPVLRQALQGFCSPDLPAEDGLRWLWLAGRVANALWDDETWEALSGLHVRLARQTGALAVLPVAMRSRVLVLAFTGEFDEGTELSGMLDEVSEATGTQLARWGSLVLAAWRGREAETSELLQRTIPDVLSRGEGMVLALCYCAKAVLCNGRGRYSEAQSAAETACEYDDLGPLEWGLTELIEAASRTGQRETAGAALERLSESTQASGTDWALGVEAQARALLCDDDAADSLYREAIDRLGRTRMRVDLGRAHLVYGEWLRRAGRRLEARKHLHVAYGMMSTIGADSFAERARRELVATGETVRKRAPETRDELTAQEGQIARLAAQGMTNPEIGAELFISPRTVEWHLHKVFAKLGLGSRKELRKTPLV
jgi:DNA-binding CsgD family transcriptional regulator